MEHVDDVVVGAGVWGGIVAKELVVAGLRVMLLDCRPSFTASDFGHDATRRVHDYVVQTSG